MGRYIYDCLQDMNKNMYIPCYAQYNNDDDGKI